MTIVIRADGRRFSGTPLQIVQQMQSVAFGQDDVTLPEYIERSVRLVDVMEGVSLKVTGESDEQLSASFLDEMVKAGLALRA